MDLKSKLYGELHIPFEELNIGEKIGSGSFGSVHKGTYHHTPVAIKLVYNQDMNEAELTDFHQEVTFMATLRHPSIVTLIGACFDRPDHALVMEYMYKDLYNVLRQTQPPLWSIRYKIAIDAARGLLYLHSRGLIHSDLKSLNILINEYYSAKISDFGLSKLKSYSSAYTILGNGKVGGSLRWMAPELFEIGGSSTKASDIYSFGMVLWELGSLKIPFEILAPKNEQVYYMIFRGKKETISKDTPQEMALVIESCWKEVDKRISMEEAIQLLEKEYNQMYK